eukprot:1914013-Rhodomonas_salina.2
MADAGSRNDLARVFATYICGTSDIDSSKSGGQRWGMALGGVRGVGSNLARSICDLSRSNRDLARSICDIARSMCRCGATSRERLS